MSQTFAVVMTAHDMTDGGHLLLSPAWCLFSAMTASANCCCCHRSQSLNWPHLRPLKMLKVRFDVLKRPWICGHFALISVSHIHQLFDWLHIMKEDVTDCVRQTGRGWTGYGGNHSGDTSQGPLSNTIHQIYVFDENVQFKAPKHQRAS